MLRDTCIKLLRQAQERRQRRLPRRRARKHQKKQERRSHKLSVLVTQDMHPKEAWTRLGRHVS